MCICTKKASSRRSFPRRLYRSTASRASCWDALMMPRQRAAGMTLSPEGLSQLVCDPPSSRSEVAPNLVLPNPDDMPSHPDEFRVGTGITIHVSDELGSPEVLVSHRRTVVL